MRACLQVVLSIMSLYPVMVMAGPAVLAGPDTQIVSAPPLQTNQTTATFNFSSNTPGVSYECSFNAGAYAGCLSPVTRNSLSAGSYTFCVRAVDSATKDDSPACHSWTVDLVPPEAHISEPANNAGVSTPDPIIKGTTNEPFSKIAVFVDDKARGEVFASSDGKWNFNKPLALKGGSHTVSAEATDPAGNVGARSSSVTFSVVTTLPTTTIVKGPPRYHKTDLAAFVFGSSSGATAFECRLDAAPDFTPCPAEYLVTKLSEGLHTLRVRAKDSAGNVDPNPAVHEWNVVLGVSFSPEISKPAEGDVVDEVPIISGSAVPYSLVTIYIDDNKNGVVQADEAGSWNFRPLNSLAEGEHKLTAEASDVVGNASDLRSPVRTFSVHLGGCAASGSQPLLPLLGLGWGLLAMRRRRSGR